VLCSSLRSGCALLLSLNCASPAKLPTSSIICLPSLRVLLLLLSCHVLHVQIQSGRRVVPTELGVTLIKGYQLIDPELCKPHVRAADGP
jgi:hypothetical protein